MSEEDKHFIKRYEELLDKGYCNCNEMNCIDNNSPRRILKIVKEQDKEIKRLKEEYMILQNASDEVEEEKDKEIERLNFIIKEVREYINKYLQEHIIDEYPDEQSTFYDEEDRFIPNAKTKLLEILDKADKDV